jgi:DNA repair protein SbcC/Rad50
MKLSGFLNKPRWQSKEADVRRAGVAADDDAELLANLARLARDDADAGVRSAALKRLADVSLAQRLARDDADAGVRTEARKLWFDLLAGTHPQAPSSVECARLIRAQDEAALIEHVARNGVDADLRAAALARVTRSALLAERATADPTPALRLQALERIDDEALLERLAERTRKTDKLVSRRARERADALRIARGDDAAVSARARMLCERLERMVRVPESIEAEAEIDRQWASVASQAGDQLRARYRAARGLLVASRDTSAPARREPPPEDAAAAPAEIAAESPAEAEVEPAPADVKEPEPAAPVEPLLAQARFAASLSAASESKQQERQAKMQRIESAVLAFEIAVNEGSATRAHTAHAELAALRKATRDALSRPLMQRLAEAERGYAELSQWQHWSDNQRRRQLCEVIEGLAGSGLHPDAVATRVREAQTEWSRLDAAEGNAPAGHAAHGWARRFHAACRHALEPAKSYFRKRQELRKTHAQAVATCLEQAGAIPEDSSDWALIATTRHAIVDCLRALDRVDPHERKVFARNLKTALTQLDARLTKHHAQIESAKSALIVEAQALAAAEAQRAAASSARTLQQRWRDIGNGRRDRDQAQWKVFRAALDAVFGKLDAERSQRTVRDAESRTQAEALCVEMENLARTVTPPQRSAIAQIESAWDALNIRDEPLLRRFRVAQAGLRDAGARRERVARRTPYDAWLARYRLCRSAERAIESAEDLRVKWDAAPQGDIAAAALAARFEAAKSERTADAAVSDDGDEELRDVLIRLEIFAGLESPHEDHELRRKLQVERLSARMRGAAAATPDRELADLLTRWTELAPTASPALDARLERDLAAAIETLP